MPACATGQAFIGGLIYLQAIEHAGGAGAAGIQPVSVGVQAVLNVVFVDGDSKFTGKFSGSLPGFYLEHEQTKIVLICGMATLSVTNLM